MKKLSTLCLALFLSTLIHAQTINIDAVLSSIEENNVQLKAKRKSNVAVIAEKQAANTLGETLVEYSPFYQRGVSGIASSELIVSQSLDFPTLYSSRAKAETLQQDVLDMEYYVLRRDIFVEAKKLCYELVFVRENAELIAQRYNASDSLRIICEKRLQHGDATVMEQNRVDIDLMNIRTEIAQNKGEEESVKIALKRLGADPSLLEGSDIIPHATPSSIHNADLLLAEANITSAKHEIRLSKQELLPKLTVGYRRNTEVRENLNGFIVGISMPLFSNSKKVKAARLKKQAFEQEKENTTVQLDARKAQLQAEVTNLNDVINAYDLTLMKKTLSTLMLAVSSGQISIMDYYIEAERVFSLMQNRLSAIHQRNISIVELESL